MRLSIACIFVCIVQSLANPQLLSHKGTCPPNEPLLIVVPDVLMGLTNQIINIVNAILLGSSLKRNICLGGFYGKWAILNSTSVSMNVFFASEGYMLPKQVAYSMLDGRTPGPKLIHAGHFLNFSNLNEVFQDRLNHSLQICHCSFENSICMITDNKLFGGYCRMGAHEHSNLNITKMYLKGLVPDAARLPEAVQTQRIMLGCPWRHFNEMFLSKERDPYLKNIKFTNRYYNIVRRSVSSVLGTNSSVQYSSVHLRVENDFIKDPFLSWELKSHLHYCFFLYRYVLFIREAIVDRDEVVLVHTGLKLSDELFFAVYYLKLFYKNIVTLDKPQLKADLSDQILSNINISPGYIPQVDAVFDFVAAQAAKRFVGCEKSTFSGWIANIREDNSTNFVFSTKGSDFSEDKIATFKNTEYPAMLSIIATAKTESLAALGLK